jgi:hypothetical protein
VAFQTRDTGWHSVRLGTNCQHKLFSSLSSTKAVLTLGNERNGSEGIGRESQQDKPAERILIADGLVLQTGETGSEVPMDIPPLIAAQYKRAPILDNRSP